MWCFTLVALWCRQWNGWVGRCRVQGLQIRQIWLILCQNCSNDSTEVTEGVTSTPEIFGNKHRITCWKVCLAFFVVILDSKYSKMTPKFVKQKSHWLHSSIKFANPEGHLTTKMSSRYRLPCLHVFSPTVKDYGHSCMELHHNSQFTDKSNLRVHIPSEDRFYESLFNKYNNNTTCENDILA